MSLKQFSILSAIIGLGLLIGWNHLPNRYAASHIVGAVNMKYVGALPTYLSGAGISSSATSIGVLSLTIKQTGQILQMADFGTTGYVTLEPGSATRQEFASFTGITQNSNGTAVLTGVSRGLSTVYPYTASTTQQFAHGGGTTLIVSNSPPFYNNFANQNNDATISGVYTFQSWALPQVSSSTTDLQISAATNTLATVSYVQQTSFGGVSNATAGVKGIVQIATALQASSTTALAGGSTGASVLDGTNITSATPGASLIVMAQSTGKILQGWLDLAANWTFTGGLVSSASTTIAANSGAKFSLNGVAYTWPSTGLAASSSPLLADAANNVSWGPAEQYQQLCDIAATGTPMNRATCNVPSRKFYKILYGVASTTVAAQAFRMQLNGDSGANYQTSDMSNAANTISSGASGLTLNVNGNAHGEISCWNEITSLKTCVGTSAQSAQMEQSSMTWINSTTTAVSSISVVMSSGNFGYGTRFRFFSSPD